MSNKLITLDQAVARYTRDGMQYASGAALPVGSDAIVFGRELLRQQRQHLHVMFHSCSQQLNLLCAAGAVDRLECGFSGLEVFGLANGVRRAVESGRTVLEDYSNLAMTLRFLGGALNWPFVPATVNIGSDLEWRSAFAPDEFPCASKIPSVTDPFSGQTYGAFSVLKPDLAAIHVTLADVQGNAIMLGTEWSRFELSRAAQKVILIADAIVATDCMRQYPNLVRIPDVIVEAVVYWPFAAWPQASPGLYDSDEEHMFLLNEALKTEAGYLDYRRWFVDGYADLDDYLALISEKKCELLSTTPTRFLMDPFRRWVLQPDEVHALLGAA
jgi:glutaconate CoA-transferase subunit A